MSFISLPLLPTLFSEAPGVTAKCKVSGSVTLGLKARGPSHYFVTHVNPKWQSG